MQFRVLGPLEVRDRFGEPVRLGSPKLRAVLAVLLVSANRPLSVNRLVDSVWPDRPPPTAVGALRTYVSALRRELQLTGVRPPRLVTDAAGYRMEVTEADLDLLAFEELATRSEGALRDARPGKTSKGNRWLRAELGTAAVAAGKTDTFLGERYRRIRRRRGKKKAIVALARTILQIAYLLIDDPPCVPRPRRRLLRSAQPRPPNP